MLAFALTLGTASYTFAEPPSQADKVDVLVSFTEKPGPDEQALIHNNGGKVKRTYHVVPTVAASMPQGKLDSLRRNPKVTSVEEDIVVQITEETLPWGTDRIDAEVVHSQNKRQGVKVAILDTGIDLDHPDLRVAGNVSFVYEAVNGDDDHGHGTMVAGVVAALDNDIGVVGVAPEAELYAVKVLNQNGSSVCGSILSGIEWAIDNNMHVINMSFGSFLNLPWAVQAALDKAYEEGIVLVAGAGNAGDRDIIFSPARYEPVIAVGATDQNNVRASFSCTGSTLELMAPGVSIPSTSRNGSYGSGSGTSLSTPHVTGVVALLVASGVYSNVEVRLILRGTAQDLGPAGWDIWNGCGLVNAADAIAAILPSTVASGDTDSNSRSDDRIPPITRMELHGLPGNKGWYCSDVMVELTAIDDTGGSGVAKTEYSLDDGKTWHSYSTPFTIALEGKNTIAARSHDNAGNLEQLPAWRQLNIDKTAPNVNISVDPEVIPPANHKHVMVNILVTSSATDKSSGLYSFQLSVRDEYGLVEPTVETRFRTQIQLEAQRQGNDHDGRTYIISITATDGAGNTATAEATVTVSHDRRKQ